MSEKIKNIIAEYVKIPVEQLHPGTLIGRSAVGNSIILHRMYAALAKEGIDVTDSQQLTTYADLLNKLNKNKEEIISHNEDVIKNNYSNVSDNLSGIGIDIEEISKMPITLDFREDSFYKINFATAEIAYCIIQASPYASFAGLFAAKEAIVKADNDYKNSNYNQIIIDHLPEGKPIFNGFNISISHAQNFAIAVAVKNSTNNDISFTNNNNLSIPVKRKVSALLSVIAIVLAIIAICINIFK